FLGGPEGPHYKCKRSALQLQGPHYKCVCNTAACGVTGSCASAYIPATVHSQSAVRIRSRTRHSGSRTLHFENCSHCPSSVEQAVTVTGPSLARSTSAPECRSGLSAS